MMDPCRWQCSLRWYYRLRSGELGEIVFVDITTEGEVVAKEEVFGTIEAVKTVSDLFMPVSGEVIEANAELDDKPELVNEDVYGNWMVNQDFYLRSF